MITPPQARVVCAVTDCGGTGVLDGRCPGHLTEDRLTDWLASLTPGTDLDLRECRLSAEVFPRLRAAVRDEHGIPRIGRLQFQGGTVTGGRADLFGFHFAGPVFLGQATFEAFVDFAGTRFGGDVHAPSLTAPGGIDFGGTEIEGTLYLEGGTFGHYLGLAGGRYHGEVQLRRVEVEGGLSFSGSTVDATATLSEMRITERLDLSGTDFRQYVSLNDTTVADGPTDLSRCRVTGPAVLDGLRVAQDVNLDGAVFEAGARFIGADFGGEFVGVARLHAAADFTRAAFRAPAGLSLCAPEVLFKGARFEEKSTVVLRYTTVDLTDAVFLQPVAVSARSSPFEGDAADESAFAALDPAVRILSLRGVDAAMLSLAHTDLSECRFAGSFHLDQVHLEGRWILAYSPPGLRRTRRQVLAEERLWRAWPGRSARARAGWGEPPQAPEDTPGLATLTTVYRQLRKAREDAKDEPGAADLYYGEMEMRRHGQTRRRAERWLLDAYWLLSGYGLRASRALGWLALAMFTTIVLIMGFGLPDETPRQEIRRVASGSGTVTVLDKPDPRLTKPFADRFTGKRFDKALSVTLNSVVFRTSGQDLTTAGGYVEMVSRFTEPVLMGLAALAIRGRLKRGS
ncbi:pentapeptide repeat-containing protein [Streptomyces sp. NPDC004609]|uniref:pentapeptide repeat-containing protein n=1 Tax=Streptomyces sp. NPDC004609 TaxID=3364704 RepID=UPI0036BF210D